MPSDQSDRNHVHTIAPGVHQVHVEAGIDAPAEHVYAVLTDFEAMPDWSTKWVGNEGPFELGKTCACFYMIGKMTQRNNLKDYAEFNEEIKARAETTWRSSDRRVS